MNNRFQLLLTSFQDLITTHHHIETDLSLRRGNCDMHKGVQIIDREWNRVLSRDILEHQGFPYQIQQGDGTTGLEPEKLSKIWCLLIFLSWILKATEAETAWETEG